MDEIRRVQLFLDACQDSERVCVPLLNRIYVYNRLHIALCYMQMVKPTERAIDNNWIQYEEFAMLFSCHVQRSQQRKHMEHKFKLFHSLSEEVLGCIHACYRRQICLNHPQVLL